MSLRVLNTLSGEKEDFFPFTQGSLPVSEIARIPGVVTIGRKPIEFAWNSRTGESYLDMSGGTEWKVQ